MLNTLRHLLPDSTAWRLVVDRTIKKYLAGVASVGTDAVAFIDDVSDDLYPQTTRELAEWMTQFGIEQWAWGSEADLRDYLAFRWGEERGQSPKHLQGKLQAAGFDAYVYDSFDLTDVALSTYTGDSMTIGAQDADMRGFCFAENGNQVLTVGRINNQVFQYKLTASYDLSTASAFAALVLPQDNEKVDIQMSSDGSKLFLLGSQNDSIYEYDLPTPYSLSGITYVDALSVTAQETIAQGFAWKPDGTEVYVTGTASDNVHQYSLSTPWDISSASFTQTYNPSVINPVSVTFNAAGTIMLLKPLGGDTIVQRNLSTAWDISTASPSAQSLDVGGEDTEALYAKLYGNRLFVLGQQNDDIYRYRFGAWRDPLTYASQPFRGNTQCGDDGSGINPVAECGEQPPNQDTIDSATCNALVANEVWYLVNKQLTDNSPRPIPTDNSKWGAFWYVGGTPIGTELELDTADRERFEKLCLKHGPAEDWIVTILDLWSSAYMSDWEYRGSSGNPAGVNEFGFGSGFTTAFTFNDIDANGVDQQAALATLVSGDKLRLVRNDDGSWIDYVLTSNPVEWTGYWTVPCNITPTAQSQNWPGFPAAGTNMKVYHRESV